MLNTDSDSIQDIVGCTDSTACNYNVDANIEDSELYPCKYVDGVCQTCVDGEIVIEYEFYHI